MMHGTSTSSLMSEDVTVRCRVVRRAAGSSSAPQQVHDEPLEMTCTMRHWDKASPRVLSRRTTFGGPAQVAPHDGSHTTTHNGPELLLTPLQDLLPPSAVRTRSSSSNLMQNTASSQLRRGGSFRNNNNIQQRHLAPVSVILLPLADFVLSDVFYGKREFTWTTGSHGSWRIQGLDQNAFDIVVAFLQARLPPERLVHTLDVATGGTAATVHQRSTRRRNMAHSNSHGDNHNNNHIPTSTSSLASSSCLDVDMLTAAHLQKRVDQETFGEKVSRRVSHVLAAVSDWGNGLSTLFDELDTKCCSGGGGGDNTSPRDSCCDNHGVHQSANHHANNSTPTTALKYRSDVEMPPPHSTYGGSNHVAPNNLQQQQQHQEQQVLRPFRYSDLEMDDNDSALSASKASTILHMASASQASSSVMEGGESESMMPEARLRV